MIDGHQVTLPDDSDKASGLIFWRLGSDLCMEMIKDTEDLLETLESDEAPNLYLINLDDPLDQIRAQVNLDNPRMPFAYQPTGSFFDQFDINALPLFIILLPDGKIMGSKTGYNSSDLYGYFQAIKQLNNDPLLQGGMPFFKDGGNDSSN